ncbi:hypothetical protein BH23BAC1_BH23BAC1_51070 [soil metagenome]
MINSEGIIEFQNLDKILSNTIIGLEYGTENLAKAKEISIAVDKVIELSRVNLEMLKSCFPDIIVALSLIEFKLKLMENVTIQESI